MKNKFQDTNGLWYRLNGYTVSGVLWVLLFALYFPAARAGFVTDFTGWLDQVKNHPFWEYINRSNFHVHCLYQVTQFHTYIFYHLFGINAWAWHILFITLHAINCGLLFRLCSSMMEDAGVKAAKATAFAGVLLFCVSPYLSEVVIWEPSYHYLQGLLFILLILVWVKEYFRSAKQKYIWSAALVYLVSTHTLEVFYITPWLVLTLALFYKYADTYEAGKVKKVLLFFFVPQLLMFCLRLVEFRMLYGEWVSRIGTEAALAGPLTGLGKPAKYLFHLLFLGRFLEHDTRQAVYKFLDGTKSIVAFYSIAALLGVSVLARFRKMSSRGRMAGLLFVWTFITLGLLLPLWFGDLLLVMFDRYTYFTSAFLYMLVTVLAGFITLRYVRAGIIALYALVNLRFAIQVSRYWGKAYRVDKGLLYNLPDPGNRIIVLLNLPESMHGVPMIGSEQESEYKLMHNLLLPDKMIGNTVYDGLSYNMLTPEDGAQAVMLNDSTVRVTLNQWGTWWWYEGKGGHSYENRDYKLNMIDGGHFYELTLHRPAREYLLLYQVGGEWKEVKTPNP